MAGDSVTGSLCESLADLLARPVDGDARKRAALHVLDWAGCAALGATSEAGRVLAAWGQGEAAGPAFAFGAGRRAASTAAFVNGGLGNVFEMDDLHRTAIVHPGDVVVPAALAVAEVQGAAGAAFLDAVVRGYEAMIRVGQSLGPAHYRHWYNTSTCGVFGAAAAVASLLRLDTKAGADALALAGQQAAGLWQCRLEPGQGKQLNTAHATRAGLVAAELAACGGTGPRAVLEGPLGLYAATSPDARPETVTADPDGPWRIFETSFKPWAACRHAHPAIEAMLALRPGLADASGLEMHLWTYRDAIAFCDNPTPTTAHEARFSLQHCLAVTWLRGAPALEDFEPEAIADPSLAALRRHVVLHEDPALSAAFPGRYGARLALRFSDGTHREIAIETAKGDPENPMTGDEIVAKARDLLTTTGREAARIEAVVSAAEGLAGGGTPASLTQALEADADRPAGRGLEPAVELGHS